jgi:hypothetical protein
MCKFFSEKWNCRLFKLVPDRFLMPAQFHSGQLYRIPLGYSGQNVGLTGCHIPPRQGGGVVITVTYCLQALASEP